MRLLLDTHFIIWMSLAPDQLRPAEARAINRWRSDLVASVASLWEIRTKWETIDRRGDRKGVISPQAAAEFLDTSDITIEALTRKTTLTSLTVEIDHSDPFDRMLLIHAEQLGARLLTRDGRLAAHPLALSA